MSSQAPVVIVTGSTRGIGREIALAFARRGARVAVHGRSGVREAESVAKEIVSAGGEAMVVMGDVRDPAFAEDFIKQVVQRWERLDVLINNAGTFRDRTLLKMTDEEWQEVIDVNLTGAFRCLRAACRLMAKQKEGSVINIGSWLSQRGSIGNANYAASKGGLAALTKTAAREMGRFNIRVNCVLPGFHPTDMGKTVWEKYPDKILGEHVLGRLGDLKELADFVVHIASQTSASGQVFPFESRIC